MTPFLITRMHFAPDDYIRGSGDNASVDMAQTTAGETAARIAIFNSLFILITFWVRPNASCFVLAAGSSTDIMWYTRSSYHHRSPLGFRKSRIMRTSMPNILAIVISLAVIGTFMGAGRAEAAAGDVEGKIRTLRAALSYGDIKAKLGAIGAIAKLGRNGEGAAKLLVGALSDSDRSVRHAALGALGAIGPSTKEVVAAMIKLVEGKDASLAAGAVNVLRLTGPGAAPAIDALLKYAEGNSKARRSVIQALGKIGPAANRAVPMIIQAFKTGDRNSRESAAYALGNIARPVESIVPVLIAALGDSDNVVRERGALGLGKMGPPAAKAQAALRKALKDTDRTVASRAAWALGRLGASDEQTIALLIESLQSTDINVLAATALGQAGKPGIDALVKMLGRDPVRRLLAVRALGQIGRGAAAAAPAVRKATSDSDANVRRAAVLALKKIVEIPAKCLSILTARGKHALACKSGWNSIDGSWEVKGNINISGSETLAMIDPKHAKRQYALPKELANSLGEKFRNATQFPPPGTKVLAKWLGTGKRDEKSSSSSTITTTSKTRLAPDGTTQIEISLTGVIETSQSHRLASRHGPNWNESTSSMTIKGRLVVDSVSGRIINASIMTADRTKGRYFTQGHRSNESYSETCILTISLKPPLRR